jgi:eukaryotic-like serine/threonine-protein kinase
VIVDATSRHSAQLRVLTELEGGWRLEQLIGLGGSAAVYRGRRADGCVGAVKVMHSHLSLDAAWLRRFKRETTLLLQNPCSGVARVLEVGPPSGPPFFVMELLQGQSLEARRVALGGTLPVAEALAQVDSVLQVLSLLHGVGVVHRDLKPSNLFHTEQGQLKVLDFGIATGSDASSGLHTTTRGILGTPAFMSPEQARGRWDLVDSRSDLWSLGATLFTLLSGQIVHMAGTENERLGLAMSKPARSLGQVLPRAHPKLIRLVDRALAYDARDRFQSADEFRRSLQDALLNLELVTESHTYETVREPSVPVLPMAPRGRWASAIAAASVVASLGVLSTGGYWLARFARVAPIAAPQSARPSEQEPAAPPPAVMSPSVSNAVDTPATAAHSPRGSGRRDGRPVRRAAALTTPAQPARQPLDERVISRVEAAGSELLERRE